MPARRATRAAGRAATASAGTRGVERHARRVAVAELDRHGPDLLSRAVNPDPTHAARAVRGRARLERERPRLRPAQVADPEDSLESRAVARQSGADAVDVRRGLRVG